MQKAWNWHSKASFQMKNEIPVFSKIEKSRQKSQIHFFLLPNSLLDEVKLLLIVVEVCLQSDHAVRLNHF